MPVVIKLSKDDTTKKEANLFAYVVDQSGKILEKVPFKEGQAALEAAKGKLTGQTRIYVSQEIPKQLERKANELMLIKGGAYQVAQNFTGNTINVVKLPGTIFQPWHPGNCLLTGNITNTITLDGSEVTGPVCHARVHLMEVEIWRLLPRWPIPYPRIPDWVIAELRKLLGEILRTPPIPDPIGPVADLEKVDVTLRSVNQEINLRQSQKIEALPPLPPDVVSGMTSPSLDIVRATLANNHLLLSPYICLWPWFWPWFYECDEDNITYTDSNGHFEYWENLATEDGPLNIYTWVEVQINGQWVTVYHPPLPCHTLWNYACGTPINIHLHDARIAPCVTVPAQGEIVWVKRIGNGTSVRNLAQHPVEATKPSPFADERGLTNSTLIEVANYVSPFSGSFPFYIQFGDGFPSAAVTHFRWKYHRIADADLTSVSEGFTYQGGALSKPYTYQGTDSYGNTVFYTGYFPLDVSAGTGKIYKIPHVDASVDTGIPTAEWNQDTVSVNVDATSLQNGLYEFVLELCDGSGNAMNNLGPGVFLISTAADANSSQLASVAGPYNSAADPGYVVWNMDSHGDPILTQAAGFRFLIRIDNDPTTCGIYDAQVLNQDGTIATTDTLCGFAQYEAEPIPPLPLPPVPRQPKAGDEMLLRFFAQQPHRFGRFDYSVKRGNSSGFVVQEGGQVPEPDNSIFVAGAWISYQYDPTLTSLLGTCDKAAFAENLYLSAYHTNGTTRLQGYDTSAVAAFAIEPQP